MGASPCLWLLVRRLDALLQAGFDEGIEVAVEHFLGVADLDVGAQILDPALVEHIAADLVAPADVGLRILELLLRRHADAHLVLVEARAQHLPGLVAVAVLRAVVLALDDDAGRDVRQPHRRVGLVDVLAARARGAEGVGAHVGRVDVDLDRVVDLRIDEDAGERGVPAARGIERALPHQAVHAGLGAQEAEGVLALDLDGGALDAGDVAGIKSATIKVEGEYAFGLLRTETGVHRLVRKSPFDSSGGRHTSFASVFVYPEVDDSIEIDINPADVRTDTFRASGAGGQHINKTDSAVRLTHVPTGIVVQCQNDRSQHRNRDEAWQMLRSRLYEHEMRIRMAAQQKLEDSKTDVGWGHQIRSYVLDQSRIKDLRTNVEISNTQKVLDGDLDAFIEASLKQGVAGTRTN